jgi:cell surface protein SprA
MDYEDLKNGWRKWRIPLNQYDTIVSPSGSDYKTILAEALYSRVWLGSLNPGVAESKVQIVSLAVVGNSWEETTVADLYKTINAMMDLMPSDALTALYTQLKGFERYAKQYYLSKGKDEDEPEPEPQPEPDVTPVQPE